MEVSAGLDRIHTYGSKDPLIHVFLVAEGIYEGGHLDSSGFTVSVDAEGGKLKYVIDVEAEPKL